MLALSWDGNELRVVERDPPSPTAATPRALVRMVRAGVCNTDLEIARGYMGFRGVLGHELLGVVEEGPAEWVGKRVVAEINFACGACRMCDVGLGRHCADRTVMGILGADGALAELVSVPVANLRAVPDTLDDDQAVFTEPLAAAFEILEQVPVQAGISCVVLGDGKLGLLVAQVLALAGGDVLAVGKHAAKLAILARRGIRTATFDAWSADPERGADVVVEATGSAKGFAAAVAATRPRGTLVMKSTVNDAVSMQLAPLIIHEITLVGSRCGRFEPALAALDARQIDVTSLISARVPLDRAAEALRLAAAPGMLKVLVEPVGS